MASLTDEEILKLAEKNGITPIPVKQGYAGCSGLTIGDAIATADPSIARAAASCNIQVIPVPDKDILLPGYDHGFFGGCGGVWQNRIYLCGTPDPNLYHDFLFHPHMREKSVSMLCHDPLYDCGGIKFFSV